MCYKCLRLRWSMPHPIRMRTSGLLPWTGCNSDLHLRELFKHSHVDHLHVWIVSGKEPTGYLQESTGLQYDLPRKINCERIEAQVVITSASWFIPYPKPEFILGKMTIKSWTLGLTIYWNFTRVRGEWTFEKLIDIAHDRLIFRNSQIMYKML